MEKKFDERLRAEIEKKRKEIEAKRITAAEVKIPVLIEFSRKIKIPEKGARREKIKEMKAEAAKIQEKTLGKLERVGVSKGKVERHWISSSMYAELTIEQLESISKLTDVQLIKLAKLEKVTCIRDSVPLIHAPDVWKDYDCNGHGVRVAVLDTGVDKNHPALAGKVVAEFDTTGQGVDIPGNHATHVAGIIVSNGDPSHIKYKGVAPTTKHTHGAALINGKVLTSDGRGNPDWVIHGIQQAVYEHGADVINLSLGWSHIYHGWVCPDGHCSLCEAVDNAVKLGVVVVVAAGNEDNQAPGRADTNIRCPGNARGVITVGATDKSDTLARFSSRGPTPYNATKPDICAPGVSITSTVLGGGWAAYNGTSMATPHIAGVAALLLQKYGHLVCKDVKHILMTNSIVLPGGENEVGAGRVDALRAFEYFDLAPERIDVYVRDVMHDRGEVPVVHPRRCWSVDIWNQLIVNGDEAHGIVEPHVNPEVGQPNYVFVRIHNRGSATARWVTTHLTATFFAAFNQGWPDLGEETVTTVLPGQTRIVGPFMWYPPSTGHGCYKAGLDYFPHRLDPNWKNIDIGKDNNVAQKNIDVVDLFPNESAQVWFYINGVDGKSSVADIEIDRSGFPRSGTVKVVLLRRHVEKAGLLGVKVVDWGNIRATTKVVTPKVGKMSGIPLESRARSLAYLLATLPTRVVPSSSYPISVKQKINGKIVGQVHLLVGAAKETPYVANRNPKCLEVHKAECVFAKKIKDANRMPVRSLSALQDFPSAKRYDGCKYCLPAYHLK